MNVRSRLLLSVGLLFTLLAAFIQVDAHAQVMRKDTGNTPSFAAFTSDKLNPPKALEPLDDVRATLGADVQGSWNSLALEAPGPWKAYVDSRNGLVEYAEGAGLPWIPGRGNRLSRADISAALAGRQTVDVDVMERLARTFLARNRALFGVAGTSLVLNRGRSGQPADYLWFIDFDVVRDGLVVEGAGVTFRINHGNLTQFGADRVPPAHVAVPPTKIDRANAKAALAARIGGFEPADTFVDQGSLHLFPVAADESFDFGKGYGLLKAWQFTFRREGVMGTWRARVDATSGEVLEIYDVNEYGSATGGVYPDSFIFANETIRPVPFTNLSTGGFSNAAGVYAGSGPLTSSLNGQYVRIVDTCGAISLATNGSGDLAFGSSTGTNCTTPGVGGAGNTHSSRMQFYHVNRAKEVGRGWLPSNTWLNAQLTVNVNLNQTCNAYWNGSTLNFFRSGGGCGNTGEITGVSLHEYGHGLDANDGNGSAPDNGTGETYGDFTAALATHNSCIGNGFLGGNCGGYGNACTACTGVRDIDWAKHTRNTPSTVANFTQTTCPNPSIFNPNYKGPCGKEGHCESVPLSEALWDLANRDLPSPGSGSAWAIVDRLWYLSRSTSGSGYTCSTATSPWTSSGCVNSSYFRAMRLVDDDNGNLADGTPHGGAIFAAFNRHGFACASDPGANVTSATCASPAAPSITVTPGNNQVTVGITGTGVFDVYKNEVGCNAGFIKRANDVTGSFNDTAVANGVTYFYQVVAHPSGSEACAGAPSVCLSVTPASAPCVPPGVPTGVAATATGPNSVNVTWSAVTGASEYHVYRATTSGGPYTLAGTATGTSFSDTGRTCNTAYFYVMRAANSATCESGNSAQASATTTACVGCTTTTLYSHTFETGTGLSNWTTGTFVAGGSTIDWRGIQTCTAQTGTKIFRFGGLACTDNYGSNRFSFAQPNGAAGISVPAGATTTRLTFGHRRRFESGFDGGTLTVSVDGTNYEFVPASAILSGTTYNGTIAPDCAPAGAAGAAVFTGATTSFTNTTVNLDAACNAATGTTTGCAGRAVRIGFTTITDCTVTDDGWFLDNVTVTACTP